MSGTVIAVPIVNVHGFLNGDRYLPDRRDLNRSFPGSASGSLAARIANLFMTEIVKRCDVGIDLHTGSDHRTNLPHVRADLDDPDDPQARRGVRRAADAARPVARRIACARRRPRTVRRCCSTKAARRGGSTPTPSTSASAGSATCSASSAMIDPDDERRRRDGADREPAQHRGCAPGAAAWRSCRPNSAPTVDAGTAARCDPRLGRQASEPDHRADVPAS